MDPREPPAVRFVGRHGFVGGDRPTAFAPESETRPPKFAASIFEQLPAGQQRQHAAAPQLSAISRRLSFGNGVMVGVDLMLMFAVCGAQDAETLRLSMPRPYSMPLLHILRNGQRRWGRSDRPARQMPTWSRPACAQSHRQSQCGESIESLTTPFSRRSCGSRAAPTRRRWCRRHSGFLRRRSLARISSMWSCRRR